MTFKKYRDNLKAAWNDWFKYIVIAELEAIYYILIIIIALDLYYSFWG